jgi:hypothetical protein
MSSGASLAFPGGRTLVAWWRQLAGINPEALWVGHFTWYTVETLVEVLKPRRLPPLEHLVLKAVDALKPQCNGPALAHWLGLELCYLNRVLSRLSVEGLLGRTGPGNYLATEAGRLALANADYSHFLKERRVLHFLHGDWLPNPSARFVDLNRPDRFSWQPAPHTDLAAEQLRVSPGEMQTWKRRGLSNDVQRILADPAAGWDQVPIASAQRCFMAIVRAPSQAGGSSIIGWEINPRNWELHAAQPAFEQPDEGDGWFLPPQSENSWREAFVEWARQRDLPWQEALNCHFRIEGCRLIARPPVEWHERLRSETWVLAGDGPLRPAARLEFV